MYSKYCAVMVAMGISLISICCFRIKSSNRSSGPSYSSRWRFKGEDTVLHDITVGGSAGFLWGSQSWLPPAFPPALCLPQCEVLPRWKGVRERPLGREIG